MIKFLDLQKINLQYKQEIEEAILQVYRSGWYILGKEVENFEDFINFNIARPGQDIRYALNDDKIRSLGWSPKCNFDEEIKVIVEYYKYNFIW